MDYWGNGHVEGIWSVLMMLGMLTFWAAVIVAIVWAIRANWPSGSAPTADGKRPPTDPERILAERLAGGQIGAEECRSRLDLLRATSRQ